MRKLFLPLIFTLITSSLYSQELFTVLISSKSYKLPDSSLVEGSRIKKGDKIKLAPGAYLGLIHVTGKTLELTQPGIYNSDSLSNAVQPNIDYATPVYFSISGFIKPYVFNERYNNMSTTGSVERGGIYKLRAGSRTVVFPDSILLQWCPVPHVNGYELKLISMYDDEVYHVLTSNEEVILYLDKIDFSNLEYNSVKIYIVAQNNPLLLTDDSYFLTILPEEKYTILEQRIREFKQLNPAQSTLNRYALGLLYERDELWLNAYAQYQCMINANEAYTIRYKNFLRMTGYGFDCSLYDY